VILSFSILIFALGLIYELLKSILKNEIDLTDINNNLKSEETKNLVDNEPIQENETDVKKEQEVVVTHTDTIVRWYILKITSELKHL
jgi:hypothetical protein